MGQDNPEVKPLLLAFGEGAVHTKLPDNAKTSVWLFDYTSELKFSPKTIDFKTGIRSPVQTGYDFVMKCFLRKLLGAYDKGAVIVYVCLDRGSPPNKIIEQELRNVGVVPMETPVDYYNSEALINDYRMIDLKDEKTWKSFISNPNLYRRLVHYITMRMIGTRGDIDPELRQYIKDTPACDYNDDLDDFSLDYRFDKKLFLHGGRIRVPDPDKPRAFKHPEPFLLEFKTITTTETITKNDASMVTSDQSKYGVNKHVANNIQTIQRSVQINRAYNSNVINNLLEGEVSALYYAQPHIERGDNIVIVTPDIDVLMMLLLSCPDRINPETGKFINVIYVKLVVSQKGGKLTRYVNVHQLWCNIHAFRPLKRFGVPSNENEGEPIVFDFANRTGNDKSLYTSKTPNEFVSKLCAMCLLCGTDYVKFYCLGITNRTEPVSDDVLKILFGINYNQTSSKRQGTKKTTPMNVDSFSQMEKVKENIKGLASMPWIVHTFLKYYDEFENMITITRYQGYEPHLKIRTSCKVDIDEASFIEFTRRIYVEHYTTSKRHRNQYKLSYGDEITTLNVRRFLNEGELDKMRKKMEAQKRQEERLKKPNAKIPKTLITVDEVKTKIRIKRNRMPPSRKMRVSCRHLLWQIEYMLNGYKMNCSIIDPTTLYMELPYYGWYLEGGRCKIASRVSLKRPNVLETKKRYISTSRVLTCNTMSSAIDGDDPNLIENTHDTW